MMENKRSKKEAEKFHQAFDKLFNMDNDGDLNCNFDEQDLANPLLPGPDYHESYLHD